VWVIDAEHWGRRARIDILEARQGRGAGGGAGCDGRLVVSGGDESGRRAKGTWGEEEERWFNLLNGIGVSPRPRPGLKSHIWNF